MLTNVDMLIVVEKGSEVEFATQFISMKKLATNTYHMRWDFNKFYGCVMS